MSINSEDYSLLRLAKALRQFLRYQYTQIYFSVMPRFAPKINEKNGGVNFVGFAQGELGLGQAMRSMAFAALSASIPLVVRKFKASIPSKQSNDELVPYFSDRCQYPINIICVNPDTLLHLPSWISYSEWGKRYNIGYWFWELENFPHKWQYATSIVDEIWVATDYIANAMRKSGKKVVKIPFPLEFQIPPEAMNKPYFGINPDQFTFLCSFDFLSSMERKNPQGVIKAFKQAFSKNDDSASLIIKTMDGVSHSEQLQKLKDLIEGDTRIQIRDESLSQEQMRGLIRSSDCYISLHRAEGLGLGLAEAMYLGKPTIATGYSGNLEFMNDSNSILIPYRLVQIKEGEYSNSLGAHWAEPDIATAALKMRELAANSSLQKSLGANAQLELLQKHSYQEVGKKIASALNEIGVLK